MNDEQARRTSVPKGQAEAQGAQIPCTHERKMAALARMAGGVAHDIRNHLTVIKGFAEIIQRMGWISDEGSDMLKEILAATGRAEAVTGRLLSFSREGMVDPETVDLCGRLRELRGELSDLLGPTIRTHLETGAAVPPVLVDADQLDKAVIELARNGAEAMGDTGELRIAVRPADDAAAVAARHEGFRGARAVVLEVADTGEGMDAETKSRMFDPFFTTKQSGSGIGLMTVYGLVRQSGGAVEVSSVPGRGTTVRVFLPAADDEGA